MTTAKSSAILGASIIISALIFSASSLSKLLEDQNILTLENGTVRLGKIYDERLKIAYEISNTETGEVFLSTDTAASNLYSSAKKNLDKIVNAANKDGGIKNEEGKLEKLKSEQVSFKVHMTVKFKSYIEYRSEYQPSFALTIDTYETTAGVGAGINNVLINAKDYSSKVSATFFKDHILLKRKI